MWRILKKIYKLVQQWTCIATFIYATFTITTLICFVYGKTILWVVKILGYFHGISKSIKCRLKYIYLAVDFYQALTVLNQDLFNWNFDKAFQIKTYILKRARIGSEKVKCGQKIIYPYIWVGHIAKVYIHYFLTTLYFLWLTTKKAYL